MPLKFFRFSSSLRTLGMFLFLGAPLSVLHADVITLTNGQIVEGIILKESEERVVVRNASGEFSISRSRIKDIQRDEVATNQLRELRNALQFARLAEAQTATEAALESGISREEVSLAWQESSENVVQLLQNSALVSKAQARTALQALQTQDAFTTTTALHVARFYLALEAPELAARTLQGYPAEELMPTPAEQQFALQFLPRLARTLHQQGFLEESLGVLETLRTAHPERATQHRALLALHQVSRARQRMEFEEALRLLREEVHPTSPEIARDRLRLLLTELSTWAKSRQREDEARAMIQRHATAIDTDQAHAQLEELLLHQLDRFIRETRYDDVFTATLALDAREARLDSVTEREALARFYLRYQAINRADPLEIFELALDAREEGLEDQALELFTLAEKNPYMQEAAREQRLLIREEQDLRILNEALNAFDAGLMERTLELCNQVTEDPGRESAQVEELRRLADLARKEIIVQQQARPYQAEALYQEAERSFHLGELDQAYTLLDTIIAQYADTPAAERGARLLTEVGKAFEIELLEGRRKEIPTPRAIDPATLGSKEKSVLPLKNDPALRETAPSPEEEARLAALKAEIQQLLVALDDL
ncbi:MAG: hypothetical protein SFY68_03255 [Candidatus Sumerlaeia bacterium]|nr:hypothetical protein [Candidatus Sumerlaeia bacterium]